MDNFKDNETDIQHLIISSLEGTASEEELLVLQKWLEESEQRDRQSDTNKPSSIPGYRSLPFFPTAYKINSVQGPPPYPDP